MRRQNLPLLFLTMFFAALLTACAGGGSGPVSSKATPAASKITVCKSGDKNIADSSMCLQDDAACYQLSNGSWCTGPRGATCPAGSRALKKGEPCPRGSKCFSPSMSLNCVIDLN